MPGTRTAPTIDGAPNRVKVSVTFISAVENTARSESYLFDANATNAEIEAFLVELQKITTASIFRVEKSDVYQSVASKANASDDGLQSLDDKVVIRGRNSATNNLRYFNIPAPVSTMFLPDSELIDTQNTALTESNEAFGLFQTALTAVNGVYPAEAVFFSERQETNEATLL